MKYSTIMEDFVENKCFNLGKFKNYVNSFKRVVIWGAGNLGTQLGIKMDEVGLGGYTYWDIRHAELKSSLDKDIESPFSTSDNNQDTLVIIGIINGSNGEKWTENELKIHGYSNYLQGMELYELMVCPFDVNHSFKNEVCLNNSVCSLCNCKKYLELINDIPESESEDYIAFQSLTFIISTSCSLNCINCGQLLNRYENQNKYNRSLEQLKRDIDLMLNNVDKVAMVSLIGGEPFLHPDVDKIANYIISKKNVGSVNITTNGIFSVDENILANLISDRIKVSFSDYTDNLSLDLKEIFSKNVKRISNLKINYSVGKPIWYEPGMIKDYKLSQEELIEKKSKCENLRLCSSVLDGKYIPCTTSEIINGLQMHDYSGDSFDLTESKNIKKELRRFLDKPYYNSCKYCSNLQGVQVPAGEQFK